MPKLLLVGLDGADPKLIDKWKEDLPNLSSIMREGTHGTLESTLPSDTCPAWNSLVTGKNPGKTGVYGFVQLNRDGTVGIVDASWVRAPAIWDLLSRGGKRVGILNVPVTYPPTRVNGFMVTGFPTPLTRRDYAFPSSLIEELDSVVGGYEIDLVALDPRSLPGGEDEFLNELWRVHFKRMKAAEYLIARYEWDFFFVVFRALDLVQHHFWHYMDAPSHPHSRLLDHRDEKYRDLIKKWYTIMDECVGRLSRFVGDDSYLMIASDHGFGPISSCFLVNEWLMSRGMLNLRKGSKGVTDFRSSPLLRARRFLLAQLGSENSRKILRLIPSSLQMKATSSSAQKRSIDQLLQEIDWTRTRVFALGGNSARFYLNLPEGLSENHTGLGAQRNALRDELVLELSRLKSTQTNQRFSCRVYTKEELYSGEYLDMAPDLVAEFFVDGLKCTSTVEIASDESASFWTNPLTTGGHVRDGVWMVRGPNVRKGTKADARIVDLAPTILYLLGFPIPADTDGRVPDRAFTPASTDLHRNMGSN